MEYFWAYLIAAVIWGIIWGAATNSVISNKGYNENWFWLGFFLGFIGFIIALTKPDNNRNYHTSHSDYNYHPVSSRSSDSEGASRSRVLSNFENYEKNAVVGRRGVIDGYWKCSCKNYNSADTEICTACGKNRDGVVVKINPTEQEPVSNESKTNDNIETLKKLKELLDMGAINEEEYEKKKKELLNL